MPRGGRISRLGLIAVSLCLAAPLQAQEQFKTNFSFASFDDGLKNFEYSDLPDLADAMVENTRLTIVPTKAERVVLIAGVVDAESGDILYGSVSNPILANRGKRNLIELAAGPLGGAWETFEDPLLSFEDPLLGFEDPLLGFEDPLLGFEDPLLGFSDPSFGFETIGEARESVWGTGGVALEPSTSPAAIWGTNGASLESPEEVLEAIWGTNGASYDPGTKLLVLVSVSLDPDSKMTHSAAILPFKSDPPGASE